MRRNTCRHSAIAALLIAVGGCSGNEEPAEFRPTTILEAVLVSDTTAVRDFLARGADVNAPEVDGTTLLMRAIHGRSPDIAKLLIDAGANVSTANRYGVNALYLAAHTTDAQTTRELLAAGADANASLPEGETALMTAAKAGSAEIVRLLLAGDARSALPGNAATEIAPTTTSSGYFAVAGVSAGIKNRADPNAKEGWHGQTALMWAAAEGHADVVRLLIEAGANVNAANQAGQTAVHSATIRGSTANIQYLADHGADLNAKDLKGHTPLDIALGLPEERIPYNEATATLLRHLSR